MTDSPFDRATTAISEIEAESARVTVSAVRARAGVSMEAARAAVETWRLGRARPVVAISDPAQEGFARLWAIAVAESDARYTAAIEASNTALAEARAEAREAGELVDVEAKRAEGEAARAEEESKRAVSAEQKVAGLEGELKEARKVGEAERAEATRERRAAEGERAKMEKTLETTRSDAAKAREESAQGLGKIEALQEQLQALTSAQKHPGKS